jgi:hypothetical protein
MDNRSKRSEKFALWLKDLTPEKIEKLVLFERKARMLCHVFSLTGGGDEKLMRSLVEANDALRGEYEKLEVKSEDKPVERDIQSVGSGDSGTGIRRLQTRP